MGHRFDCRALRSWCALATVATLFSACVDQPLTPPNLGSAATQPSRDILDYPIKRLSDHFAYLMAHQPNFPSYSPLPEYSYNASGGAIRIVRTQPGIYTVLIDSLVDSTGYRRYGVSVVAYGATTIGCAPYFSPYFNADKMLGVEVRCYDRVTRTFTDSRFSMLVVGAGSVQGRHALVYTLDHPFTPDPQYSFTSGPGPIVMGYDSAASPVRNVKFGTGSVVGTTALITPNEGWNTLGDGWFDVIMESCQLGGWVDNSVDVRCFNRDGAPMINPIFVMQLERGRTGRRFGFAYANQQSTASYAPAAGHSYNSSGGAITVSRTAVGRYTVDFDGLETLPGHSDNVQVTPYGGDVPAACNVVNWANSAGSNSLQVFVECRRVPTGAYRDVKFNVVVIE